MNDARAHGSVTYRATAEQAQTCPQLQQAEACGMTERETIQHMWLAYEELRRVVLKREAMALPPPRTDLCALCHQTRDFHAGSKCPGFTQ